MNSTPWEMVRDHLVDSGVMTRDGITRTVRARGCRECSAKILAGLDDDVCAWPCLVDPTPLAPLGEFVALATGRFTVELVRLGGRLVLEKRDNGAVAVRPAGSQSRRDVLAQHRCGSDPLPSAPTAFTRSVSSQLPKEPPF